MTVEPVYPLTAGLAARQVAKVVEAALGRVPDAAGMAGPGALARHGWPGWRAALAALHAPGRATEPTPTIRRGGGSPTTNSWPTSWPWPLVRAQHAPAGRAGSCPATAAGARG